nr:UDP-glycosyltransferase 90A1-like [Tanacetum cinerariifolium]
MRRRENGFHPTSDDGFEERVKEKGVVVREWVNQREILGHEIIKGLRVIVDGSMELNVGEYMCGCAYSCMAFVSGATVECKPLTHLPFTLPLAATYR